LAFSPTHWTTHSKTRLRQSRERAWDTQTGEIGHCGPGPGRRLAWDKTSKV